MPFCSAARRVGARALPRLPSGGSYSAGLTRSDRASPEARPEGRSAPVQWHPELGGPPGLADYVAAQAYAAGLIARALPRAPEDALGLETETFFGAFRLARDGLQVGHELSVIQWRGGRRELLLADDG